MDEKLFLQIYNFARSRRGFFNFTKSFANITKPVFVLVYIISAFFIIRFSTNTNNVLLFFIVPLVTLMLSHILRMILKRQRPHIKLRLEQDVSLDKKSRYSCPSNHTVSACIIAFACMLLSVVLGVAVLFLAVLTAISRIIVGAHYPFDILLGFLLSAVMGFLGFILLPMLLFGTL